MTPTERARPHAAAGRLRRRRGRSPTSTPSAPDRGRPADAAGDAHRRPRTAAWFTRASWRGPTARSGWPSVRGEIARLRDGRRRSGWTTSSSGPTARARGSARCCSTWSSHLRPDGFALWVFESNTGARRLLRAPRAGRARAHRRLRATRSGLPTSGWPGRAPTRWRSTGRMVEEVDEQLGDLLARRVGAHPGRAGARRRRRRRPRTGGSGRSPSRSPRGSPSSGPSGSPGSCARSSPRASTRPGRTPAPADPDCRCALPPSVPRFA